MNDFLKDYGVDGPLGFPMPDRQARALDHLLKSLPSTDDYAYRKAVVAAPPTELNPGERSDVSWISTESPDRGREVVVAKGMNDSQFQANPLVTLGHSYWCPPVGKSLWRKRIKDGDRVGIKAKTKYPERRGSWPKDEEGKDRPWPPDTTLALVQAGLLNGKSIGFLPLKVHTPDEKEYQKNGWAHDSVKRVIDEWLLIDYACCFLPVNQDALVEAVSKGAVELTDELARAMGLDAALFKAPRRGASPFSVVPFITLAEAEEALERQVKAIDFDMLTRKAIESAWDRARGRV
jgi:hypothetical protein